MNACLSLHVPGGIRRRTSSGYTRRVLVHIQTAGTVAEALAAVRAGVDGLVAQGVEAGGHVRGETSTLALVPAIVDAVDPTPVLAAGGIADARGVSAALALGAQGGSAPVRHSSGMGSDSRVSGTSADVEPMAMYAGQGVGLI